MRLDGDEAASAADRAAAAAALAPAFAGSKGKGQLRAGARAGSSGGAAWRAHTAADFHRAYAAGALTPSDVAENVIAAVAASEAQVGCCVLLCVCVHCICITLLAWLASSLPSSFPALLLSPSPTQSPPMRFLVAHDPKHLRAAAAASSERWRSGKPLSPLDGVPFAGAPICSQRSCHSLQLSPAPCSALALPAPKTTHAACRAALSHLVPSPLPLPQLISALSALAVKDCVDALPYPTTGGTAFMAGW